MRKHVLTACVATVLTLALVAVAEAQRDPETTTAPSQGNLRFTFTPPGARSLAMGGTFVAIADDATAAEANPAGLVILERPEVSVHFRASNIKTETVDFLAALIDERIRTEKFESDVSGLSFASFVFPIESAAFSVYFQRQANFQISSQFVDERFTPLFTTTAETSFDLLLENVGGSAAVQLGRYVSFGGSVRYTQLDLNAREFFGTDNRFDDEIRALEDLFTGKDSKVTYNIGLLVNPNGSVSAGFVYKKGETFDIDHVFSSLRRDRDRQPVVETFTGPGQFTVPDVFTFGVAFRPPDRSWVMSADVTRVQYSDLTTSGSFLEFAGEASGIPIIQEIKDGTEVHVGGEYTFLAGSTPIAVRSGVFTDPDHDGLAFVDSARVNFTFGAGLVIAQRLQIDVAVNLADDVEEGLLSSVFRF